MIGLVSFFSSFSSSLKNFSMAMEYFEEQIAPALRIRDPLTLLCRSHPRYSLESLPNSFSSATLSDRYTNKILFYLRHVLHINLVVICCFFFAFFFIERFREFHLAFVRCAIHPLRISY